jgi:hypothetical protein
MEDRGGAYRVLVGKPERNKLLARPKPRWENNTKMSLQNAGYESCTESICFRIGTCGGLL